MRLSIAVQYGIRIHVVCRELQQNIREAVERYTGLEIGCIQVDVEEITVP
ncbi:Asp23/Gls24 family envelope stress response protein [Paenibacillus sp. FSL L8-0470]